MPTRFIREIWSATRSRRLREGIQYVFLHVQFSLLETSSAAEIWDIFCNLSYCPKNTCLVPHLAQKHAARWRHCAKRAWSATPRDGCGAGDNQAHMPRLQLREQAADVAPVSQSDRMRRRTRGRLELYNCARPWPRATSTTRRRHSHACTRETTQVQPHPLVLGASSRGKEVWPDASKDNLGHCRGGDSCQSNLSFLHANQLRMNFEGYLSAIKRQEEGTDFM